MVVRDRIERMKRIWPWPPLTRRDILGAVVVSVLLATLLLLSAIFPADYFMQKINYGFGPGWDCVNPGKPSALSCIKRLPGN